MKQQALAVLRKMAKQRQDSIDSYTAAGETARAQAEREELSVMEQWLPTMANEETLRGWIIDLIRQQSSTAAAETKKDTSAKTIGQLTGALMKEHKNVVDGKLAQRIIKEELAKL
jgi:uncharacterized protein